MVRVCAVRTCKVEWTPNRGVSFFSFPLNNKELQEKWLQAGPGYKTVSKYSCVCSNHFSPEDYSDSTKYGGMRKLKKNAVPSVFNDACNSTVNYNQILDSDDSDNSECGYSSEANVAHDPSATNLRTSADKFEALAQSPAKRRREWPEPARRIKKFASVAVQTCPRLSGPSDREKELQAKIHRLQDRLRRRDRRISNVTELVTRLKDAGKCSDNLEAAFLKKFTNFDLELFNNEEKNGNVGKNAKSYTREMKEFASTLYYHSPRAYEFVRAKINLPHASTLRRWVADSAGATDNTENSAGLGNTVEDTAELEDTVEDPAEFTETVEDPAEFTETVEEPAEFIETVEDHAEFIETVEDHAEFIETVEDGAEFIENVEDGAEFIETVEDHAEFIENVEDHAEFIDNVEDHAEFIENVEDRAEFIETAEDSAEFIENVEDHAEFIETVEDPAEVTETVEDHAEVIDTVEDHAEVIDTVEDHAEVIDTVEDHAEVIDTIEDPAETVDTVEETPDS